MRQTLLPVSLVAALLFAGCGSDLDRSPEDNRKAAEKMSEAELEAKLKEFEKRVEEMQKKAGDRPPNESEMKEIQKIIEVTNIYATELTKRKMNK